MVLSSESEGFYLPHQTRRMASHLPSTAVSQISATIHGCSFGACGLEKHSNRIKGKNCKLILFFYPHKIWMKFDEENSIFYEGVLLFQKNMPLIECIFFMEQKKNPSALGFPFMALVPVFCRPSKSIQTTDSGHGSHFFPVGSWLQPGEKRHCTGFTWRCAGNRQRSLGNVGKPQPGKPVLS